jgi:26S proteasome regulatory subunit N6
MLLLELEKDPVIHRHLKELYQKLFEENLLRIVSPFSQVEIVHVAELIELDVPTVEKKLSAMILDKKLLGILDQGNGCLIVFEEPDSDSSYPTALDTIANVGQVVDSLYTRANKLR